MQSILTRLTVATLFLVATSASFADTMPARNAEDIDQIRATIMKYIQGIEEKKPELLHEAFDVPNAHMKIIGTNEDGTQFVRVIPIADVIPRWIAWDHDGGLYADILSLDIEGGRFATVALDFGGLYWDQMVLFKINDEWKIVSKISMSTKQ